jgi:hypothetical protein
MASLVALPKDCPQIATERQAYSAWPISLLPAERNRATEAYPAVGLAPSGARIVAVGQHNVIRCMTAAAWVIDIDRKLFAGVESDKFELGREVLVRLYTLDTPGINRAATFEPLDGRAVALAEFGLWDGKPVGGIVLFALMKPGEEC